MKLAKVALGLGRKNVFASYRAPMCRIGSQHVSLAGKERVSFPAAKAQPLLVNALSAPPLINMRQRFLTSAAFPHPIGSRLTQIVRGVQLKSFQVSSSISSSIIKVRSIHGNSARKRFIRTGKGHFKYMAAGRKHRMRKHSRKRNQLKGKAKVMTTSHAMYRSIRSQLMKRSSGRGGSKKR